MPFQPHRPFSMLFPMPECFLCLPSLAQMSLLLESPPDPPGRGKYAPLWGPRAPCLPFPLGQHRARHRTHTGPWAQSFHYRLSILLGPYPRQTAMPLCSLNPIPSRTKDPAQV